MKPLCQFIRQSGVNHSVTFYGALSVENSRDNRHIKMRFSVATALSPHCGVMAVEVRFVRDGELQGLQQGGQLVPYGCLDGTHIRPNWGMISHSSMSSPKNVVDATCLTKHSTKRPGEVSCTSTSWETVTGKKRRKRDTRTVTVTRNKFAQ